jgi:hypothetical protein
MQTEYKNLKRPLTDTPNGVRPFPVGYYQLHPDVSINCQLNRFYTGDERMLTEMRTVAPRIHTYADLKRELLTLAEQALAEGERLKAASYLRIAEFFIFPDEPAKLPTREHFLHLVREHYGIQALSPDAPQKAFTDRIGAFRVIRRFQYLHATRCCNTSAHRVQTCSHDHR